MKKIIFAALSVLMILGLVGCGEHTLTTVFPDQIYIVGNATPCEWDVDNAIKMDKEGTSYTITLDLVAGEFKFTEQQNWNVQYGANGKGSNQESWKVETPGTYKITYDMLFGKMDLVSLSTSLDEPLKVAVATYLKGGCGDIKLTKDAQKYTGEFTVGESGAGAWGEAQGFIKCCLISCPEANIGDPWKYATARWGSGNDEPQKIDGSNAWDRVTDFAAVGSTYEGLKQGGNFLIKGVKANTTYTVLVDMTSGTPVITVSEKK